MITSAEVKLSREAFGVSVGCEPGQVIVPAELADKLRSFGVAEGENVDALITAACTRPQDVAEAIGWSREELSSNISGLYALLHTSFPAVRRFDLDAPRARQPINANENE